MSSAIGRRVLHGLGSLVCISLFGVVLSSCSDTSSQQQQDRRLEVAACKQLSPPPPPVTASNAFLAIAVRTSLITDLAGSGNSSLERIARDLRTAANEETLTGSATPMIHALATGVTACRHLGFRTGS
jgi:hypothetical protein